MKLNDAFLGALFFILAGALFFGSGGLPNPTRQPYGPDFFPRILAVLLAIGAGVLILSARQTRQPAVIVAPWARDPRAIARVLLVPAGILLFVLGTQPVGFIICAALLVSALMLADGRRWPVAILTGVVTSMIVHTVFYVGLRVQLPWGLLAPVRW